MLQGPENISLVTYQNQFIATGGLETECQLAPHSAQLGALCCNWELRKYQEVESSHLVSD